MYIACPIWGTNKYQLDLWLSPSSRVYVYFIPGSSTVTIHLNKSQRILTPTLHHSLWLKPSSSTIVTHICSDHGYLHNYTYHFIRYGIPLFITALKLKHAFLKLHVKVHQRTGVENRWPMAPPHCSLGTVTCSWKGTVTFGIGAKTFQLDSELTSIRRLPPSHTAAAAEATCNLFAGRKVYIKNTQSLS